jgi:hypothetical protein
MTSTDIDRRMPVGAPDLITQSTAVEQSRAVAQVLAAYTRADQRPRDRHAALVEMREVCRLLPLAERAFFSFNRGDGNVTGPTVHLARELARIWGNLDYGLSELRRDDTTRYSEMQAYATDLQTNVRVSTTFTVPHARDGKRGKPADPLTTLRDVYENNANMGSRRVRSQLYAVLPKWFTDEAESLCRETLRKGESGVTLVERIDKAITLLRGIGVSRQRIEQRVGRKIAEWTVDDVADLGIIYQTINRREQTAEDAFPAEPVTADEIRAQARSRKPATPANPAPPPTEPDEIDPTTDADWPAVQSHSVPTAPSTPPLPGESQW